MSEIIDKYNLSLENVKHYSLDNIPNFIEDIQNTVSTRERWEYGINLECELYQFSMKLLYIKLIEFENNVLNIFTEDGRGLRFLITEDTLLEISKVE